MAQSVEHLALDFGSGHDLMVRKFKPCIRLCADNMEPACDSLSPSLSVSPPLVLSFYLKIKKKDKSDHIRISTKLLVKGKFDAWLQQLLDHVQHRFRGG